MLDGDDEAIHSSTIAQQPQVWSIKEHHYPIPSSIARSRPLSRVPSSTTPLRRLEERPSRLESLKPSALDKPINLGPPLHGNLPQDIQFDDPELHETATGNQSPYSPPSSPRPSFRALPTPLVAQYIDRSTGLPTRSTYSTWTGSSIGRDGASTPAHFTSSSVKDRRHQEMARYAAARANSQRDDPTISIRGYADPYGFSSPAVSQPNSHPSSSTTSLDNFFGDARSASFVNTLDDAPEDIVLTGKACT